jgi:transcriptional regulator GlxA family with amidase domain
MRRYRSIHFVRAFKRSEGVTPHDYLVQCRVRRAQELMTGTDLPLSEIAVACGFSDQSHYTRQFRARVGITPSRYRQAMRPLNQPLDGHQVG